MNANQDINELDKQVIGTTFRARNYPMTMAKASGSTIWDERGRKYIDFMASACVANTGHCHPKVVKAIKDQFNNLTTATAICIPNKPTLLLAKRLIELTPGDFEKKVWFGSSGSDACDAIYDFVPIAKKKRKIISFYGSHHGLTVGTNFLSGHKISSKYLQSPSVVKVPYPYCYRCPFQDIDNNVEDVNTQCCNHSVKFIEEHVFQNICPPEDTAGIILEPIASLAGEVVPPFQFIKDIKRICDKYDIFLISDEVKAGFGRTGKMFAIEHSGVVPDAITLGKPMASGFPLSAIIARKEIVDSEHVSHATSGAGHPAGSAACLATLDVIQEEKLMDNATKQGNYLRDNLNKLKNEHEMIGDVRGIGLLNGVEIVKDKRTKEPAPTEALKVCYGAWKRGLLFITVGTHSNVFEITPPLIITREEIDKGLEIMNDAFTDVETGKITDSDISESAAL